MACWHVCAELTGQVLTYDLTMTAAQAAKTLKPPRGNTAIVKRNSGSEPNPRSSAKRAQWPRRTSPQKQGLAGKKKGGQRKSVPPHMVVAVDPGSIPCKCKPANTRWGTAEGSEKMLTAATPYSPTATFRIYPIWSCGRLQIPQPNFCCLDLPLLNEVKDRHHHLTGLISTAAIAA